MTTQSQEGTPGPLRETPDPPATQGTGAVVWAIVGEKTGDNAQALALARALGLPFEQKRLLYNRRRLLPNWLLGATLATTTPDSRATIEAPWPDLVIGTGQRSVPVARWIKRQSGGRTRLVQIGRPRAPLNWFDLVVTTPQYGLPPRPNVVQLDLPFQPRDRIDDTAVGSLSDTDGRPTVGLLVGGDIGPYRFDDRTVETLAEHVLRLCASRDAALMVTAGRRLGPQARERLRAATAERTVLFHAFGDPGPNPYDAILARCERIVVTTDSVSMIADAVGTGRPVHLFSPSLDSPLRWRILNRVASLLRALCPRLLRDALVARALVIPPRQTERVATSLIDRGAATWLCNAPPSESRSVTEGGVTREQLLQRLRDLLPSTTH